MLQKYKLMLHDRQFSILTEIANCRICSSHLPHAPRPVLSLSSNSRLLIIGQAPGKHVHQSGIPWSDASGKQLRDWLQLSPEQFYDTQRIAIIPMGFCYPGKEKNGDLPPRPECAPTWHSRLLELMPHIRLTLLIGSYAQAYYLRPGKGATLTSNVAGFAHFLPQFFPLPHPSPRNRFWLSRNPWFAKEVLPVLRAKIRDTLNS